MKIRPAENQSEKTERLILQTFADDVFHEIDHAVAVAPLIVIPADELEELAVQLDAATGVEHGTALVVDEVGAHHFVAGPAENALEVGLAGLLHGGADFLVAGFFFRLHGEIDHGNRWCRHAEGHAGKLALHFWDGQTDGLGGTCAAWDDVDGSAAATFPILGAWAVHRLLCGGVAVDGGHEAFCDAETFFQQNVNDWSEAVGGAGCVGDDVVISRIILLMVHAHDDGDVLFLTRSRDDDLLSTGVDVTLGLAALCEETGGLDDDVHAKFFPRQSGWTCTDGEALDLVTIDNEHVVFRHVWAALLREHVFTSLALGGVILHEVGEIVRRHEVVDGDDVDLLAEKALITDCAKHEAADAPETIDADFDHLNSVWDLRG